jgi:hypothetical protein
VGSQIISIMNFAIANEKIVEIGILSDADRLPALDLTNVDR